MLRLPLLSVNCVTSIYIMKEQSVCSAFCQKIWATQKTTNQIWIESKHGNQLLDLESQVKLFNLAILIDIDDLLLRITKIFLFQNDKKSVATYNFIYHFRPRFITSLSKCFI